MNILQNEKKKQWQYIALPYMRVEEWGSSPLECMWTPELRSFPSAGVSLLGPLRKVKREHLVLSTLRKVKREHLVLSTLRKVKVEHLVLSTLRKVKVEHLVLSTLDEPLSLYLLSASYSRVGQAPVQS